MIGLSAAAIQEVLRLRRRQPDHDQAFLRLGIQTAGCAGLSYHLEFSTHQREDDRFLDCGGIRIVVDAASLPFLRGLRLDYSEDLMGGSFRFDNPNAKQTCSCGHSFAVEGETAP
jgi:iron-sulfur cluster assembly protein